MAQTGHMIGAPRAVTPLLSPVAWLRIAIIVVLVVLWEAAAFTAGMLGKIDP